MKITGELDEPNITLRNWVFLKDVNRTLNIKCWGNILEHKKIKVLIYKYDTISRNQEKGIEMSNKDSNLSR